METEIKLHEFNKQYSIRTDLQQEEYFHKFLLGKDFSITAKISGINDVGIGLTRDFSSDFGVVIHFTFMYDSNFKTKLLNYNLNEFATCTGKLLSKRPPYAYIFQLKEINKSDFREIITPEVTFYETNRKESFNYFLSLGLSGLIFCLMFISWGWWFLALIAGVGAFIGFWGLISIK